MYFYFMYLKRIYLFTVKSLSLTNHVNYDKNYYKIFYNALALLLT